MRVLGIHDGHNASASLLENGIIVGALQEERLRKEKNWSGIPELTVKWLLDYFSLAPKDIDYVAINGFHMPRAVKSRAELLDIYKKADQPYGKLISLIRKTPVKKYYRNIRRKERIAELVRLGLSEDKLLFVEHHLCHASAAYYGYANFREPVLVITCDGSGDGLCATVSVGENGKLNRIASVHEDESLGDIYAMVTYMMGMVPLEHEYKIMGMAPYANEKGANKVKDLLMNHFEFDMNNSLKWKRCNGMPPTFNSRSFLTKLFEMQRFDAIMGGLQLFTEQMLSQFVKNAIRKTGIRKVALSGGIFMNVKANKTIMELPDLEDLFVFPSCGDETNAMGASFNIYAEKTGSQDFKKINSIYWGPRYSSKAALEAIQTMKFENCKVKYERFEKIESKVAELLASGEIVARFSGNEEFGARSLGNRAILADASRPELIKKINSIIKNRDFWMPFACSMLDERKADYLVNPKNISAPFMILTFDTVEKNLKDIVAGTHPYDATVRPQLVTEELNPGYWLLLKEYQRLTGRGGILNTSFNLHGFPIVSHPHDALNVLDKSGLKYLAIEDYLVSKI